MNNVTAIAILENSEKHKFEIEIDENDSDKDIVNKAFEIAYCKYVDLQEVIIK